MTSEPRSLDWSQRVPECESMDDAAESAAYDRIAARWLEHGVYPSLIKTLDLSPPPARILDACSGSGRLAVALARARADAQIEGVDLSAAMLALARAHAQAAGLAHRVTFSRCDVARTGFPDGRFDAAVSYGALHHWSHPAAVLAELARVVRPGGLVLVGDWRRDPGPLSFFRSMRDTREWSLIEASVRAAYLETELTPLLNPLSPLAEWQIARHSLGLIVRGRVRAPSARRNDTLPTPESAHVGS